MTRIYNLQRDPASGEYFAIGKSDRPYSADEVSRLEARVDDGDVLARAAMVDLDLSVDRFGHPLPPERVEAARRRARELGWPARASTLRGVPAWPRESATARKARWERDRALRRTWQSVRFRDLLTIDDPPSAP